MSFSKASQNLMIEFFDVFDNFMYNKSDSQGKVDQLIHYFHLSALAEEAEPVFHEYSYQNLIFL